MSLVAIVLTILKWFVILLLAAAGFVLAVTACLLFVPVRYHVYVEKQGQLFVRGYVSWLFHFLHISFQMKEGKRSYVQRILGIPVRKLFRRKAAGKKSAAKKSGRKGEIKEQPAGEKPAGKEPIKEKPAGGMPGRKEPIKDEPAGQKPAGKEPIKEQPAGKDSPAEKGNRGNQRKEKKGFFLLIQQVLGKIRKSIKDGWKLLTEGPGRGEKDGFLWKMKEVLEDDTTWQFWRLVWENLLLFWKHSRPEKLKGWVHFGTSDPCTTGLLLGAAGAAYAAIGNGVRIVPDFEQPVLEGCLEITGKMQMMQLILILKRVFYSGQWERFRSRIQV